MAQHDYTIANQGFPAFRSDLNDALAAIVSNNSGATEPTTMFAHQVWVDTAANPSILKIRNADNDAWITVGALDQTGDTFILRPAAGSASVPAYSTTSDTNTGVYFPGADRVGITTGGTQRVEVDASGNVGISVTPTNNTLGKTLQVGQAGAWVAESGTNRWWLANNWYYNSGDKYINNGYATLYSQQNGAHQWFTAASGTAGNAITFTQAMTLNNSGNVGIGTSSPSHKFSVYNNINGTPVSWGNATRNGYLYQDGAGVGITDAANTAFTNGLYLNTVSTYSAIFTNSTERMRIDSSGIVFIGTTNTDPTFNRVDGLNLRFDGRIYSRGGNWDLGLNTSSGTNITFYTDNGSARVTAGSITSNGATTAYGLGSDYRMKTNVQPMTGALAKVLQLNPVTFTWKEEFAGTNPNGQGFIAHELQEICPDAVIGEKDETEVRQVLVSPAVPATYDDEGNELTPAAEAVYEEHEVPKYQSVDSSFLVATLTAAIQELSAKNDALEARIAALENA